MTPSSSIIDLPDEWTVELLEQWPEPLSFEQMAELGAFIRLRIRSAHRWRDDAFELIRMSPDNKFAAACVAAMNDEIERLTAVREWLLSKRN